MTQTDLITFTVGLIGIIGVGIGVIASLLPIELTGKRDYYQRLAKIWQLIKFEAKNIQDICDGNINVPDKNDTFLMFYVQMPTTSWQVAIASGDFIAAVPQDILSKLSLAYMSVSRVNTIISYYSPFTPNVFSNHLEVIKAFYFNIKLECSTTTSIFQELQEQIISQISLYEKKMNSKQIQIEILKWVGIIMFIIASISSLYLVRMLYWH